ncbi:MAG: nicotinate-nucleotide--dimethylbenzimidazole phosphoribosyltransferase [Deltaproteobacteria bacterium]|nr:nicotinate-nucleotide--dimethylbenzimidazole phosphoribosyltransferase [Deltaproteobacteria bacterium]
MDNTYTKIKTTLAAIQPFDPALAEKVQARLDDLAIPPGALGRLQSLGKQVALIRNTLRPEIRTKKVFTFAGDHGVVAEGVSAFPQEVTREMVKNFVRGGAGINVLARHVGAEVIVVDIGVNADPEELNGVEHCKVARGTKNFTKGPAMTREEAEASLTAGIGLIEKYGRGLDLVGTGDMGIGNTTPSSAIAAVLCGRPAAEVTGRGTGIGAETLRHKVEVIERGIGINRPDPSDPVGVLAKVGGFEIGGIAGLILGAAARRIPVVIDGLISTAGALVAHALQPRVSDYMIAGHRSVEIGHQVMLDHMGLSPLLDLDLRLGEGTGAALAFHIVEAGVKVLTEVLTFTEAGVTEGNGPKVTE